MSRRKRTTSAAEGGKEDWLRRGLPVRGRPWALEEQLLGTVSDRTRSTMLDVLTSDLADERAGLSQLEEELHKQAVRVASLESRLTLLRGRAAGGEPEDGRTVERGVVPVSAWEERRWGATTGCVAVRASGSTRRQGGSVWSKGFVFYPALIGRTYSRFERASWGANCC